MKNPANDYEGFCIDLLNEMAAILKFNYTIIEVKDGSYGIEDDSGRWNGIIGALQRHEADISVSAVTITYGRGEVIDFTLPFMHLGISILLAKSNDDSEKLSLEFSVYFSRTTFVIRLVFTHWCLSMCIVHDVSSRKIQSIRMASAKTFITSNAIICSAYILTRSENVKRSILYKRTILLFYSQLQMYDIEKIDERDRSIENQKNQFNVLNSLWFAVGSLMQQGSDVIPRAAATRIVAVIWWMFTQILISSYTAQLAAFLTVERMTTPIESTADLANQQKIRYGTLTNGSTMNFFRESRIPIYERMYVLLCI
ncbi:hypothetical protein DICVIV_02573 [Dictyocaulus viviparus]|uniref:Ligand-gated ion channel n=1 Tax=Dictyocaulus viviparus TaxID=29172 RepID=A0A0D8Y2Y6_DICVI|nr:hypothetical protein DICVIV_02573 [Dictyocaulus viviparus]